MNTLLKLEYAAFLLAGFFAFSETGISWWWFLGLFFFPDFSMLGYLVNPKIGAYVYNIFHHFALAIAFFIFGKYVDNLYMEIAGIILFSHISFDRLLGYGLKYTDGFHHTHLGKIGKHNSSAKH